MTSLTETRWLPIALLVVSNLFMTFAWYGHLRFKQHSLWVVILASWGIAFFEYCLMVPANRWGSHSFTPYQLKIIQAVTPSPFVLAFALVYFGVKPAGTHVAAFLCILGAVAFTFLPKG